MDKDSNAYKTIGEVAKILGLNSQKRKIIQTHTIRYWEKEFKQIKPKIFIGGRRYYDTKNIELLKKVHFLLKEQGMTINGVKKILNNKEPLKLDENLNHSIRADKFKTKILKISKIIKNIKKILKTSIKLGGSSIKDFSSDDGKKGIFQQYFKVYGRKGKKCSNIDCNSKIIRTVISNRSTFFCKKCQK